MYSCYPNFNVLYHCSKFSFPINCIFSIMKVQFESCRVGVEHGHVISLLKDILPTSSPRETLLKCTKSIIIHCLTDGKKDLNLTWILQM